MANPETWNGVPPTATSASEPDIEEMFRARYLEMVRLAGLLGADDPEDIAQEAFLRLMKARPRIEDQQAALPYLRAIVCNLTRNRHRHLRVIRQRTPAGVAEGSSEQAAIVAEDHREVIAALAELPARRDASGRRRTARRRSWPARFIGPVAAATAVVAIVLAAAAVTGTFDRARTVPGNSVRATPSGTGRASPRPAASSSFAYSQDSPASQMLAMDPPVSSIIGLRVPWTGSGRKADQVTSYFWLGFASPHYWLDQVVSGPQFCNDTVNLTSGESGGFCWPLPLLGPGQQARVTGNENAGTNQVILVGAAAAAVTSVTAALPDGRTFSGVVKAGHGLRDKAWTVGYPPSASVRLIFRNAAGTQVAVLGTARPDGPPQVAWPDRGGVTAYSYPASYREPKGQVEAYLIQGRVGFLGMWGGQISPLAAAGPTVLGGLTDPFDSLRGGQWGRLEALGYAHTDVARVVLTLPGGKTVSTSTFPAGWPGSDLRLWAVKVPESAASINRPRSDITATAYDAAGHVLGRVQLGTMQ